MELQLLSIKGYCQICWLILVGLVLGLGSALGRSTLEFGTEGEWEYYARTGTGIADSCIMKTNSKSANQAELRIIQGKYLYSEEYNSGVLEIETTAAIPDKSEVNISVDGKAFPAYVDASLILVEPAYKFDIMRAMVLGRRMDVVVEPHLQYEEWRALSYEFSLIGFTAAFEEIGKYCEISVASITTGNQPVLGARLMGLEREKYELGPRKSLELEAKFTANARAVVEVFGDGSTDLDLYVRDSRGRVVCQSNSFGDREFCDWVPYSDEPVTITIENVGEKSNSFRLIAN